MIKKLPIFIFIFIIANSILYSLNNQEEVKRILIFGVISFYVKYEIYCSLEPIGYFKYPSDVDGETFYFTYEGVEFYEQCKMDEDFFIYQKPVYSPLWANSKGELMLFRKRFMPVIDEIKERFNYPYGYARNYK